ncbi:MAG: hypothetical protein R2822_30865 [Spirosomataceae bacterium]
MGWSRIEPITPTHPTDFSLKEIDNRIADFQSLEKETLSQQPFDKSYESAYFQLVKYPIMAASKMNQKFLNLDLFYTLKPEERSDLNAHFQKALSAYEDIKSLTNQYNQTISKGKWQYMMDMSPRDLPVFKSPLELKNIEQKTKLTSPKPIISIAAGQFNRIQSNPAAYWEKISEPSFSHNALVSKPFLSDKTTIASTPSVVEYDLDIPNDGQYIIQVQAIPLHPLNRKAGQKIAIQIDNQPFQMLDFETFDRSEEWKENVLTNKTTKSTPMLQLDKGRHTFKMKMIDAGILVDYILIYSQ